MYAHHNKNVLVYIFHEIKQIYLIKIQKIYTGKIKTSLHNTGAKTTDFFIIIIINQYCQLQMTIMTIK